MRKMFSLVIVLFILYIAFQITCSFIVGNQVSLYDINVNQDVYQVKEVYTIRHKSNNNYSDKSNYYYEIKENSGSILFNFKLFGNYGDSKNLITDLKVMKEGNITCTYPVFKSNAEKIDVLCNISGKQYLYGAIKGQYANVDAFVSSLISLGYSHPSWIATSLATKNIGNFSTYSQNIPADLNLVIWQYQNFYRVTSRGEKSYFLSPTIKCDSDLATMVNQYYVTPDYSNQNGISRFYITNLITGKMESIDLELTISYNLIIQGVVDNKLYIIDKNSKIQYFLDIYSKKITISGNLVDDTKYYNNGKWEEKAIYDVIENSLVFVKNVTIPANLKVYNYLKIDSIGGDTDGYYYMYLKENNVINAYRIDKQNSTILTLIFSVPSINDIQYFNNDVYFTSGDTLYLYRDVIGIIPLVKYSEFATNKNNLYNIYVEE